MIYVILHKVKNNQYKINKYNKYIKKIFTYCLALYANCIENYFINLTYCSLRYKIKINIYKKN